MIGSGTSADPYIVSTYGELVQAAKQAGKYIEFPKEPGTINIEDEYGKTEPPELEIYSGANINGNGWTIYGLWGKTHSCISNRYVYKNYFSYIRNLNFGSFHSQGNWFMSNGTNGYTAVCIENCTFWGMCEKNFMHLASIVDNGHVEKNGYIKNCSMTIDFTSLSSPIFLQVQNSWGTNTPTLSDCIMKLRSVGEITLLNFGNANNNGIDIQNCRFDLTADNCKIFNASSSDTIVSGCVFTGGSQSAIDIGNGTPQTVNVFNAEVFPNAVESIKFVGVPHADIGNAAYLSKSGLSIGV